MKPLPKNILIAGVLILLVGGIALWPKSHSPQQQAHKDIYYCPMHPTYVSDKPGICPICQMKFEKREVTPEPTADSSQAVKEPRSYPKTSESLSFPNASVGNPDEDVTGPPTKNLPAGRQAFGGDSFGTRSKKTERKILYWTDTMIPGYKAKGPGKSPMGMDLTPVYEEEQPETTGTSVEGHASVPLTSPRQQLIGVKTEKVNVRQLTKTIRAVGTVAHDTELYQTQAEYLQANAALKNAESSGSVEIIEGAQSVVDAIRLRLIHMGFHDGLIEELKQKGQPDKSLLLGETGPVWVYAQIYQYELPYVDVGTPVVVTVPSFLQETFEGMVRAVDPMVDAMTRTVRIRIQIKDAKAVLKPDMYVNARMDIDIGQVLAVPQEAVFHTGDKDVVFVDSGKGIFQPRQVTLGAEAGGFFEIKSGLKPDEVVVTSGNFLLDSESRLKAAIEGGAP